MLWNIPFESAEMPGEAKVTSALTDEVPDRGIFWNRSRSMSVWSTGSVSTRSPLEAVTSTVVLAASICSVASCVTGTVDWMETLAVAGASVGEVMVSR
jgi:hypothetical protein